MQVERIEEMRLSQADDDDIAALLGEAFGPTMPEEGGFEGRSYYKQRHHLRLVIRGDGRVVSHMALCFRDIRMGEHLTPIVGLAEVATLDARRGEGLAARLLHAAIGEARQSLASFVVLFGDRPLYAARGFVRHGNRLRFVALDGVRTHRVIERVDDGLMVLPLLDAVWDGGATVDLVGHNF